MDTLRRPSRRLFPSEEHERLCRSSYYEAVAGADVLARKTED